MSASTPGDLDRFGELLSADFVEHDEIPGLPPTKEGVLAYFGSLLISFPDLRMDVEDLIASGNKAVTAREGIGNAPR